ncbi:MAG: GNAT family N-acetyltransferase [Steroidobacteraceae bacterium]
MSAHGLQIRAVSPDEAASAAVLVRESFLQLAAHAWEERAQRRFIADSEPESLSRKIAAASYSVGAFRADHLLGFLLMPKPTLLGMLFVHPSSLRQGIGTALWESARSRLESRCPEVKTVELNSTPFAVDFYRSLGFVPLSAEFTREGARAIRMACWLPARALGAGIRD